MTLKISCEIEPFLAAVPKFTILYGTPSSVKTFL